LSLGLGNGGNGQLGLFACTDNDLGDLWSVQVHREGVNTDEAGVQSADNESQYGNLPREFRFSHLIFPFSYCHKRQATTLLQRTDKLHRPQRVGGGLPLWGEVGKVGPTVLILAPLLQTSTRTYQQPIGV